jgi:hypothetical protein
VKITVLWEDQRGGIIKGFGPHELLVSCVADELRCTRDGVKHCVIPAPRKGNGNVIRALKQDLDKLSRSGPVCAVLDRDQAVNLWPAGSRPATCLSGIRAAVAGLAPGDYELILLDTNVETVVTACCGALGSVAPVSKPSPDERDRILTRAAWSAASTRASVRSAVPSFDRLVRWIANNVPVASLG